jgi:hypothetical protein
VINFILAGGGLGCIVLGWVGRALVQEIRDARDERLDREALLAERPAPALSGPQTPDIDVAQPFGDPPDDDDPEGGLAPSEAELDWAAEHLIRDAEDPRYWAAENRRAIRILRAGGYGSEIPADPELPGLGQAAAARDWDDLVAALPKS